MLNEALSFVTSFILEMWIHPNISGALQRETFQTTRCQICKGEEIGSEMETLLITQSTFYSKWK